MESPDWIKNGRDYAREAVRVRDGHTCQKCGITWDGKMRRFDVHHLNGLCGKKSRGYDSIKNIEGLTTLCKKCHRSLHKRSVYAKRRIFVSKEYIQNLRDKGESYDKIGKRFEVSSQAVYTFLNGH